jgi:hypothetical protein
MSLVACPSLSTLYNYYVEYTRQVFDADMSLVLGNLIVEASTNIYLVHATFRSRFCSLEFRL